MSLAAAIAAPCGFSPPPSLPALGPRFVAVARVLAALSALLLLPRSSRLRAGPSSRWPSAPSCWPRPCPACSPLRGATLLAARPETARLPIAAVVLAASAAAAAGAFSSSGRERQGIGDPARRLALARRCPLVPFSPRRGALSAVGLRPRSRRAPARSAGSQPAPGPGPPRLPGWDASARWPTGSPPPFREPSPRAAAPDPRCGLRPPGRCPHGVRGFLRRKEALAAGAEGLAALVVLSRGRSRLRSAACGRRHDPDSCERAARETQRPWPWPGWRWGRGLEGWRVEGTYLTREAAMASAGLVGLAAPPRHAFPALGACSSSSAWPCPFSSRAPCVEKPSGASERRRLKYNSGTVSPAARPF